MGLTVPKDENYKVEHTFAQEELEPESEGEDLDFGKDDLTLSEEYGISKEDLEELSLKVMEIYRTGYEQAMDRMIADCEAARAQSKGEEHHVSIDEIVQDTLGKISRITELGCEIYKLGESTYEHTSKAEEHEDQQ